MFLSISDISHPVVDPSVPPWHCLNIHIYLITEWLLTMLKTSFIVPNMHSPPMVSVTYQKHCRNSVKNHNTTIVACVGFFFPLKGTNGCPLTTNRHHVLVVSCDKWGSHCYTSLFQQWHYCTTWYNDNCRLVSIHHMAYILYMYLQLIIIILSNQIITNFLFLLSIFFFFILILGETLLHSHSCTHTTSSVKQKDKKVLLLLLLPSLSVETHGGENIWLKGLEDRVAEANQPQTSSKSGQKREGAASGQIPGC